MEPVKFGRLPHGAESEDCLSNPPCFLTWILLTLNEIGGKRTRNLFNATEANFSLKLYSTA